MHHLARFVVANARYSSSVLVRGSRYKNPLLSATTEGSGFLISGRLAWGTGTKWFGKRLFARSMKLQRLSGSQDLQGTGVRNVSSVTDTSVYYAEAQRSYRSIISNAGMTRRIDGLKSLTGRHCVSNATISTIMVKGKLSRKKSPSSLWRWCWGSHRCIKPTALKYF